VTGDGTTSTLVFNNPYFDLAGEFDSTTGIFHPSADGYYLVTCSVGLTGITNKNTVGTVRITSGMGNILGESTRSAEESVDHFSVTTIEHLLATQPVACTVSVAGSSTKNVSVAADPLTFFAASRLF
jgi:hypothetical protein